MLSDVRWKAGPLYVRYGAFLDDWADDPHTGELELCIRRPDGTPEPDRRLPVFRVPDWVQVPGFIRPAIADLGGGPRDFPYEILEALHFSNAGGVYLAKDPSSDRRVVLKEARPHAGLDPSGADAVARLRRERDILKRLAGSGIAPELLGEFIAWEHHFLSSSTWRGPRSRRSCRAGIRTCIPIRIRRCFGSTRSGLSRSYTTSR